MDQSIAMCSSKKGGEQQRSDGSSTATMRKGPWTEEEDTQLVWFVRLFGERRWDFLAKVSGLRGGGCIPNPHARIRSISSIGGDACMRIEDFRTGREVFLTKIFFAPSLSLHGYVRSSAAGLKRTGKSCRLRWVNYLHPGLRRGRITADEERLILELHAKWGSRWSRIARSLPGRTDNEIKNFWRTRTRKQKAFGDQRQCKGDFKSTTMTMASPSSSSVTTAFFSSSTVTQSAQQGSSGGDDEAELDEASTAMASQHQPQYQQECCTMDQLWNEIAAAEAAASYNMYSWGIGHAAAPVEPASMPSPLWEFCSDYSLWRIDDEEYYNKMLDAS